MHKSEQRVTITVEGPDENGYFRISRNSAFYRKDSFNSIAQEAIEQHVASLPPERRVIGSYEVGPYAHNSALIGAWGPGRYGAVGADASAESIEDAVERIRDWSEAKGMREYIPALLAIIQYFEEEEA